jgi:tRNA(fMet)-specific endonuclease VapC
MYLLDTNLCIEVLQYHPPAIKKKLQAVKQVGISVIVYSELCYGIAMSHAKTQAPRQTQLEQFLALIEVFPWDERAAEHYATIRAYLQKKGAPIGNMDLLIAAHAKSLNATLVTNNKREFARVPDLPIEDWATPKSR